MLSQLSARLNAQKSFDDGVQTILHDVIAMHGAEYGNLQLPVDGALIIVAQSGLSAPFLRTFREVTEESGCACGRALKLRKPVIIHDVEQDESYRPYRDAAKLAGYRSVQSTPLIASGGELVGVISTLFAQVKQPTKIEMETLRLYSVEAAQRLLVLTDGETIAAHARRMYDRLYAGLDGAAASADNAATAQAASGA